MELIQVAKQKKVIKNFVGVDQYAHDENWKNLANIPYFDCDLWPTRIVEAIDTFEKRVAKQGSIENFDFKSNIWELLRIQTFGFDNQYFVLFLTNKNEQNVPTLPIEELDCEFVNDRGILMDLFWDLKLEFSSERLAKFSTFWLLYQIILKMNICRRCSSKCDDDGINVSKISFNFFKLIISN